MQGVVQAIESLKNPEWFIWVQVAGVIIIPIVLSLALLCQNNKNNKNNEKLRGFKFKVQHPVLGYWRLLKKLRFFRVFRG